MQRLAIVLDYGTIGWELYPDDSYIELTGFIARFRRKSGGV
ncbi:hypothetical protein [Oceanobacillus picturae]|jgi:hypothetical protein|nr:hypothetical protein [Oceanobacillus picturae]